MPLKPIALYINRDIASPPQGSLLGALRWQVPMAIFAVGCVWGSGPRAIAQPAAQPAAVAQRQVIAQRVYEPVPLVPNQLITDKLTDKDIPTGQGGYARDYRLDLKQGAQLAIDLTSDNFDTIVSLMAADGSTLAENDDGPDGTTNSLLFYRISKPGTYYVRVRAFGELAAGNFKLKVTLLKPE